MGKNTCVERLVVVWRRSTSGKGGDSREQRVKEGSMGDKGE